MSKKWIFFLLIIGYTGAFSKTSSFIANQLPSPDLTLKPSKQLSVASSKEEIDHERASLEKSLASVLAELHARYARASEQLDASLKFNELKARIEKKYSNARLLFARARRQYLMEKADLARKYRLAQSQIRGKYSKLAVKTPANHWVAHPAKFAYTPRLTFGPFYSTDVDYFGLFDLFVPFTLNQDHIIFLDGRYHADHGPTKEGNIGLGTRNIFDHNKWIWGLYSFYDQNRTTTGNQFGQITLGGELISERFSIYANGYVPVGQTSIPTLSLNQVNLVQNGVYQNIFYGVGVEKSLYGVDGLAGYRIPHTHGLALYVGGFHYWRNQTNSLTGPIGHAEYNFDLQKTTLPDVLRHFNVNLVADYQYDSVRNGRWFAGVRFDFLFKSQELPGIKRRMLDFIRRDLNVETERANTGFKPLFCNGHICQVRQVSSEAAWDVARTDTATDIIGVRGTITGVENDVLSNNQTITGNGFPFTAEGIFYNAPIGLNGNLANNAGAFGNSLLRVGVNNTIENIQLSGASFQVTNNAAAFGTLTVQNVTTTSGSGFVDLGAGNAGGGRQSSRSFSFKR